MTTIGAATSSSPALPQLAQAHFASRRSKTPNLLADTHHHPELDTADHDDVNMLRSNCAARFMSNQASATVIINGSD